MVAVPSIRTADPSTLTMPDLDRLLGRVDLPDLDRLSGRVDLDRLLDRADLPGRVDSALEATSSAARAMIEQLPGQRRRRRRRTVLIVGLLGGLLVGAVAITRLATWWMHRSAARAETRELFVEEVEFDRDARDRAAGEGMTGSTAAAAAPAHDPSPAARNGSAVPEPVS